MNSSKAAQRIKHEITEFLVVSLLVAPFFLSFEAYRMYLFHQPGNRLFEYLTALVNALVLSKIILIGEMAGLGKRSEHKPLVVSTLYKAALFTVLYSLFHALEHIIHGVVHGRTFVDALHAVVVAGRGEVVMRALTVFFAFIPFFALFETRRVLGEERFRCLFFGGEPRSESARDSDVDARRPTIPRA